jgi:hypothetical protein
VLQDAADDAKVADTPDDLRRALNTITLVVAFGGSFKIPQRQSDMFRAATEFAVSLVLLIDAPVLRASMQA